MRIDIMTDIETLGTDTTSTIIQISAMAFDIKTGDVVEEFERMIDIEKNENPIDATAGTIKWWLNTNKELFAQLLNAEGVSSEQAIKDLHQWITDMKVGDNDVYLWGNGILFDNKMIEAQMKNIGLKYPIFYRNDRDVRTIVELACAKSFTTEKELKEEFSDDTLVAHNASDDVRFQIALVSGCYDLLIN